MKTYDVKTSFGDYKVNIDLDNYQLDNSLAIILTDADDGTSIAVITTCLTDDLDLPYFCVGKDTAFVDTNNCPWVEDFIKENKLGKPVGFKARSGFCEYPLYKFDLNKLAE